MTQFRAPGQALRRSFCAPLVGRYVVVTKIKKNSRILLEVFEAAKDLHSAGALDIDAIREFDALCLSELPPLTQIRDRFNPVPIPFKGKGPSPRD